MPLLSLRDFLKTHRSDLFTRLQRHLEQLPWSPYKEFILRTDEGKSRLRIWFDLAIDSLEGRQNRFFEDQKRVGYLRAVQGYMIENTIQVYRFFQHALFEIIDRAAIEEKQNQFIPYNEIKEFLDILFQATITVSGSFLKTREEQVSEKVNQLRDLFLFTRDIVTKFRLEEIVKIILSRMAILFKVDGSHLALFKDDQLEMIYDYPPNRTGSKIKSIMNKTFVEGTPLYIAHGGSIHRDIQESRVKAVVSVPITAHEKCYGILALDNELTGFEFTNKDLDYLYQFLYIIGVALENLTILNENEQHRQQLHLLTRKIMLIRDEEQRSLAADIHDTLAQALAGIGYKVQVCREIAETNPETLTGHLDNLTGIINDTIDQCRRLISTLRPHLIVHEGLVPSLKSHFEQFTKETGIKIKHSFSENLEMSFEKGLCVFRIVQEGLRNIHRHAEAKTANISLKKNSRDITLMIEDNGKGFDMSRGYPWTRDQNKLGLFFIKERVESFGGRLRIQAEINQGCRLDVKIPITEEAIADA